VILVDANLLLYAYDPSCSQHKAARVWFEGVLSGTEHVALAWPTILAFLRISTSPRLLEHPLSIQEAVSAVSEWLERPMVTVLNPGDRHWEILRELMMTGQARGPLVSDASLAALALEHGAAIATADRDFARFPGLRVVNPLEG
jgi:toxin-antitoxin system PIN domain toxin